jgi:hypothetical protein
MAESIKTWRQEQALDNVHLYDEKFTESNICPFKSCLTTMTGRERDGG